ncbi:methylated-DNA--[protein]-cysteine S-methyltransferase [Castellaniella sp.]|uniref:methylated-DNA--[protein]-cysteine S-methyltransferase n=1 Tax=Castellaniella sp. TaxID=1955812 RepID=UPI00355D70D4
MSFHALISSPLGAVLLRADSAGLAGLYFADQADCPRVSGLERPAAPAGRPADGMHEGQRLQSFRVLEPGQARQSGAHCAHGMALPVSSGVRLIEAEDTVPQPVLGLFRQAEKELGEYWAGQRRSFDLPLAAQGTGFQKKIWEALLAVPYGSTLSYGELARRAGFSARHGRATGAAVGSNPISIIIPCHRILASNRTLNGYGGGLERKLRLLQLEGLPVRAPG